MCGTSGLEKSQVENWCWEKEQLCSLAEQTPAHTCRDTSVESAAWTRVLGKALVHGLQELLESVGVAA